VKKVDEITTEIMGLGLEERARLAELLIVSLDAPSEEENLALWVKEAERRMTELRTGRRRGVSLDEAVGRLRAAIS
jgi:putative addiction module component (TIGR02574 family)